MDKGKFSPVMGTFKSSKKEPFHSWYPYLEGYSPDFVKTVLNNFMPQAKVILDPFAGTVTTGFAASELNIKCFYCEVNPVLQFIADVKNRVRTLDIKERVKISEGLDEISKDLKDNIKNSNEDSFLKKTYYELFPKRPPYQEKNFRDILASKTFLNELKSYSFLISDIVKVAVLSSLVPCSLLKRAGALRYRTEKELEKEIPDFIETLENKLRDMKKDITNPSSQLSISPILICGSAFDLNKIPNLKLDGVITSPPYANGNTYVRNTKLELWFLGCLKGKKDLKFLRERFLTAGINNASGKYSPPEVESVKEIVSELEEKAYDSRVPKIISGYFSELQEIFSYIRNHLNDKSLLAIDIGDSQYAGVYVPTDRLLVDTLKEIKYDYIETIKLRDRYSNNGAPLKQVLLIFGKGD